jgi:LysR family transcriptional regulator, low CO2-responsive transcriptional regulator
MRINLTHALAFHAVAEAGGFSAAAEKVGVSQSTLSLHVAALEAAAGRSLINRAMRGARLTPDGHAVLDATRDLVAAIARVEHEVLGRGAENVLRIIADSAVHALPIMAEMRRRIPGLQFALQVANSAEVIEHMLAGEADVAVAARPATSQRLMSRKLRDDRLVLILPADDVLAGAGRVKLSDIGARMLVLREPGSTTRATAEAALKAAGVTPADTLEVETREAVLEAVAAGFGAGVVFASEAGADARLARLDIADAGVDVAEYVICRADATDEPLVSDFLAAAERVAWERGWVK